LGRDSSDDGVGRHITGDYGPSSYYGTAANADTVCHNGAGADPDIVLDDDALGGDALLHEGAGRIGENVVDGGELDQG
jgi:hypothetical protein